MIRLARLRIGCHIPLRLRIFLSRQPLIIPKVLLQRVTSSYTVLVSIPKTPGMGDLTSVRSEVEQVAAVQPSTKPTTSPVHLSVLSLKTHPVVLLPTSQAMARWTPPMIRLLRAIS
ncbi:hypothetical protein AFLA_008455 [Aspergillus flavus NRRL3357]|nr:hypothetical protein AFLA_008455 [Aspergillus flavus NRRL3357]